MSYDVSIADRNFNYTYNVSKLFHDHIPDFGNGGGLGEIDGMRGRAAGDILAGAIDLIRCSVFAFWSDDDVGEPKFCALYDSPNGWGSTVGAILFLSQIMAACYQHPSHKVRVC